MVMVSSCDPDKISLDIGCSKGRFTGWLAKLSHRVIAIDPDHSVTNFKNHWQFWWCEPQRNKTIYMSTAVGDYQTIGTYHEYKDTSTGKDDTGRGSLLHNIADPNELILSKTTEITIEIVDNLVCQPVGFIKIDTEGYDLNIIRGARRVIRENRPIIVLEPDINLLIINELDEIGYDIWPLGWPLAGPMTDLNICRANNRRLLWGDLLAIPKEKSHSIIKNIQEAVNPYICYTTTQIDTEFDYNENVHWVSNHLYNLFRKRYT